MSNRPESKKRPIKVFSEHSSKAPACCPQSLKQHHHEYLSKVTTRRTHVGGPSDVFAVGRLERIIASPQPQDVRVILL